MKQAYEIQILPAEAKKQLSEENEFPLTNSDEACPMNILLRRKQTPKAA